jgi:hypothetical protein
MIDCFIFSKDRACQLDLLLRSISDNADNIHYGDISVLVKCSNGEYEAGYKLVKEKFANITYINETNFTQQIKAMVSGFKHQHCLGLVDDDVFVNKFDPMRIGLINEPSIHAISLRMNPKVNYCQTQDRAMTPPQFVKQGIFYIWDWSKENPNDDWGYPSCINGHVYRTGQFKELMARLNFGNPNGLEGQINLNRRMDQPKMACYENSKLLNVPHNLTQSGWNRISNKQEYSLKSLNDRYLSGNIISTENLYGINQTAAHMAVDYKLVKK